MKFSETDETVIDLLTDIIRDAMRVRNIPLARAMLRRRSEFIDICMNPKPDLVSEIEQYLDEHPSG